MFQLMFLLVDATDIRLPSSPRMGTMKDVKIMNAQRVASVISN